MTRRRMAAVITALIAVFSFAFLAPSAVAAPDSGSLERVAIIGDSLATFPDVGYHILLDKDFNSRGHDVETFAVGGATGLTWLTCPSQPTTPKRCSDAYVGQLERLRDYQPTKVLITLGGNELMLDRPEETYVSHLKQVADDVQDLAPGADIDFVRYYDVTAFGLVRGEPGSDCDIEGACNGYNYHPTWEKYGEMLKFMAFANGYDVIDISGAGFNPSHISEDRVHMNPDGQEFYYQVLKRELVGAS